tara:strand:- start:303 stop:899 length:597 start_codon:yes stop_codon:yes gene_type:complete
VNDLIQIVKVLNDDDLKIINDHIDNLFFSECRVFDKHGNQVVDTSIRSSLGATLIDKNDITILLHKKINDALVVYRENISKISSKFNGYPVPSGCNTISHREDIQILEYGKDQQYVFHHDEASNPNILEYHRKISVIVYLSENFTGGRTIFPHKSFKPKLGHALIFPSNWCYPHAGEQVIDGKKRIAVTWYYCNHAVL